MGRKEGFMVQRKGHGKGRRGKKGYKIFMGFLSFLAFLKRFIVMVISAFNHSLTQNTKTSSDFNNTFLPKQHPSQSSNILIIISMNRLVQQNPISYGDQLQQLCNAARRITESSTELDQHFRYYINFYIQHQRLSQQFFNCLCQHNILQKLLTQSNKHLPAISILQLFHLLVSNINKANDLVYVFSQPIVHEYLFQRFNIYKETGETIEYYVQLLKTIIMKSANQGNQFLIKLFCNKRFPTFPIFTAVTILGVSQECDELVKITAQQCVLMLVNLINRHKTGLVYLNELQMIVFFFQLIRQMLDQQKNTDKEGSIKYFIDLVYTLRHNQTSIFLVFNLLTNQLFFKHIKSPQKILRFIRQFRQHLCQHHQFQIQQAQGLISTLYRIFYKYYFSKFINYTYFCAQQIIPGLTIKPQPKLLKFYSERCRKIDQYLVNQEDYYKSQKGNDCLIDEWMEFNNNAGNSPVKGVKKSSLSEFFSTSDSSVDKYIKDVMIMAGLEVEKLKIPIIKLTYSSNFKTSIFLTEQITGKVQKNKILHEDYCKEKDWAIEPTEELLSEIYLVHLNCEKASVVSAILEHDMQGEVEFINKIKPDLARIITQELCKETPNISKQYLLLLFKLLSKLKLSIHLDPKRIQKLLQRLFYLQKLIGQQLYDESRYPSYFKYVMKNQSKAFLKQKIQKDSLTTGKYKLSKPKEPKLQHFLFYYEVIKLFLDASLKNLNQFVQEYWQINFKENGKDKPLLSYRDIKKGYIAVFATDRFQFQVFLQNKEGGEARFLISDNDFMQKKVPSSALHFQQYKNQIRLQNVQAAQLFRKDIQALRETRKDIFRRSLLEYMPFIYESIQVKYRNHRYQSSVRSSI